MSGGGSSTALELLSFSACACCYKKCTAQPKAPLQVSVQPAERNAMHIAGQWACLASSDSIVPYLVPSIVMQSFIKGRRNRYQRKRFGTCCGSREAEIVSTAKGDLLINIGLLFTCPDKTTDSISFPLNSQSPTIKIFPFFHVQFFLQESEKKTPRQILALFQRHAFATHIGLD